MKMRLLSLLLAAFLVPASLSPAYAQYVTSEQSENIKEEKTASATNADEIKKAFERAMRDIAAEKQKDEEKMVATLKTRLHAAFTDWLSEQERSRENSLNRLIEQNWETLVRFGDPAHYEYFLKDFKYTEGPGDIIKTDSLTTPYKAVMEVTEVLYVEKYHTPDASELTIPMFFYTFTNPMEVRFEYRDNKFVFIGIDYKEPHLDQGWPAEIRTLRAKYGKNFRVPTP